MRIDSALRALRGDPTPQRMAQDVLFAARDAWRERADWKALSQDIEAFGNGADLAGCEALGALFSEPGQAESFARTFTGHFLTAMAVTALEEEGFDPDDEASLHHGAKWLRRLGNNRDFIGDILVGELAGRLHKENELSSYGPQVVMLSRPSDEFFLRANIWPSADEHSFRASGGASFVYGLPHDHNLDFMTHGYFGPGYWSDYYEIDYETLDGWAGEPAKLRFIERARLEPDRLMLYRAHRDVHAQLPPDALSVSLNIMHMRPTQGWYDQYRFDVDRDEVGGVLNHGPSEVFLRVAVGLGGDEALDLAERFGHVHPSDRMRLVAWEARAGIAPDNTARDALWREAERSGSRMVAMEAKARRAALIAA